VFISGLKGFFAAGCLPLFVAVLLFCASCSQSSYNHSAVQCPEGKVSINGSIVTGGAFCIAGDVLETVHSSYCFLAFKDGSFAVIYPDSRILVGDGKDEKGDFTIEKGALYLDVKGKGCLLRFAGFKVDAGKAFKALAIVNENSAEMRMLSGSVDIGTGSKKGLSLKPGYMMSMSNARLFSPRPLLDQEIRDFALMTMLDGSDWENSVRNASRWTDGAKKYLSAFDLNAFAEISALRNLNLEKGPLSVVKTRSGKDIIGVMSVRGKMTYIITVKGEEKLPTKDVKTVTRYGQL
jgi:hypothetical protein